MSGRQPLKERKVSKEYSTAKAEKNNGIRSMTLSVGVEGVIRLFLQCWEKAEATPENTAIGTVTLSLKFQFR